VRGETGDSQMAHRDSRMGKGRDKRWVPQAGREEKDLTTESAEKNRVNGEGNGDRFDGDCIERG